MSHSIHQHSPIYCILPPYILDQIIEKGSPQERQRAQNTQQTARRIRAMRAAKVVRASTRRAAPSPTATIHRSIHDGQHRTTLPGKLVRDEGAPPTSDLAVNEAYDGLGSTFDLLWQAYQRNSIDNRGMPLVATVHYDQHLDNAFFDGQQMIFGDGDAFFNRFTICLDVIAHELGHGVTDRESGLNYVRQSGALNESLSDVWGSLVKQYKLNQTAGQADWLIGQGLFTNRVQGVALRSMKAPGTAFNDPILGKDPQPAHMRDFVRLPPGEAPDENNDFGGVHINSGIPNHAFYLAATSLGGHAWEKAGRIWYATVCNSKLTPISGFIAFARLTVQDAGKLYGAGSIEQKAVVDAWRKVGVLK
jgi:Zn-dependent metalloprotease